MNLCIAPWAAGLQGAAGCQCWLDRRLDFEIANLPRADARERRKQVIRCQLHLRDVREHHPELTPISKEDAARVRAKSGVLPQPMPRAPLPGQNDGWMRETRFLKR